MPRRFTSLFAALLCVINGLIPPGALLASQTVPAAHVVYTPLRTADPQPRAIEPSAGASFARSASVSRSISQVQPIVAQSAASITPDMTNLPLRGDVNGDGIVNVSDIIYLVNFFLANGAPPVSQCNADVTGDNSVQINDTFYLINYLLDGGPAPVGPPCAFPPVASNDSYSVAEGATLNVSPGNGVLANDHDPAGGTMTAAVVTQPVHGTLTLNADGSFTYVHDGSEAPSDSFTYHATAGTQTSPAATVTILVTPVNDAPSGRADAYAVVSSGTLTVASPGVLANDFDAEGSALAAILATQPANGALTFHADGSFTYVHNGTGTSDSFTYRATDGSLLSAPVTVSIAITSNASPSAVNDTFTVAEGGTLTTAAPGVLANDSDPESAALTATLVAPPAHGALTLNANGSFTYIHDGSESTTDSFRYQVSDGVSSSNVATVTIAVTPVNDPPVAANDSYVVTRHGTITIPAPGVAINDSDPEGSPLSVTLASAPLHGTLTLNADGSFTYAHDGSDPLIDLFTYRASDGVLDSLPATVVINVAPNSPPVANGDSYATIEGGTLSIGAGAGVLANDTDPEGSNLRAVLVSTPAHGTLTLQPSGAFTYVHDGSNTTSDSFTYRAADEVNTSAAATVLIAIAPVNDPPVAAGDAYNVLPGATLTIAAPGVLSNDVDSDSATLTAILESSAAHGTLTLNADGSFSYTNDGSSATTDSFTYRASDGLAVSAPATVSISIGTNQPPVAVADAYTVAEGGTLNVPAAGVLANDTDAENNPLTAVLVGPPAHGTLTLNANGSFTYVHDGGETTSDTFTYQANDGFANSGVATVTITITPVNDAPVAMDDAYSVTPGGTLTIAAPGVLGNDTDVDSVTLTAALVTGPAHGTLVLNTNGGFTYTHDGSATTADSFSYTASDGSATSNVATVAISIGANTAPVANALTVTTTEDTPVAITLTATDAQGNTLTYSVVTNPAHGTLSGAAPNLTYTPNANFNGGDSFTFKANDGLLDSNIATVTITVTPVNDAPVAANDGYSVAPAGTLTVAAPGVLGNDTDVDSVSLTASLVTGPAHGTLTLNANGGFTYTHDGSATTADSFTYTASDGSATSNVATVAISIGANTAPVANAQTVTSTEDTPVAITLTATDADGNTLTYSVVTIPANGTISGAAPNLTYTPNANFNGTDSFTFKANDGLLDSNIATVTINVAPVNDPPVAVNDAYSVASAGTLTIAAPGVLANDTDVDSVTLTASLVTGPAHGTLTLSANGGFTYTHDGSATTADSFTYTASDGAATSNTATVSISIGANTAPVANAQTVTTNEDTPATVTLTATDAEGNTLTYSVVANPAHGTLTGTAPNLTYAPNANFNGSDSFTFKANDGSLDSNTATVSITVTPVNDAPVAAAQTVTTNEDTPATMTLVATDVEGSALTYSVVGNPTSGTLSGTAPNLTYTPNANFNGSDSFTFKANDGSLDSNVATVSITVTPVNDPPVAVADAYPATEDTPLVVPAPGVLANDTDIDSATLTAAVATPPANGTLSLNADGSFTYTPNANFNGIDSFTYTTSDGSLSSAPATVTITVSAVNDAPVAVADAYAATEDTPLVVAAPGVLANDTDVDSATLTAAVATPPANGTLSLNADGSFTYTPNANFNGIDSFTYTTSDGSLSSAPATVTITVAGVNDAPVAAADAYTTAEDTPLVVAASGVLANDTDVDSATLTAVLVTGPANGALTLNADGSFTYTPNANFNGADSFTYKANDGSADSNVVTVSITVTAVNDAPVATADAYSTAEDTPLVVNAASGVLANDGDVDGPSISAVLVGNAANGNVTLAADGSFTYTPNADFNGTDSFTYKANDTLLDSAVATVTITVSAVNDAPVNIVPAAPPVAGEDIGLIFSNALGDAIQVSDSDAGSGNLEVSLAVTNGTVTLSQTTGLTFSVGTGAGESAMTFQGTIAAINAALDNMIFTGSLNYSGPASITITTNDLGNSGSGGPLSDTDTVNLTIMAINDPPLVTAGGTLNYTEGDPATAIDGTVTVSDPDNATLAAATAQITAGYVTGEDVLGFTNTPNIIGSFDGLTGTLTLTGSDTLANYQAALRSITYLNTSATPSTAARTVTWQANDGAAAGQTATSTINLTAKNSAPVISAPAAAASNEDTPLAFTAGLTISVSDPDAGSAAVNVTLSAANGVLNLAGTTGLTVTGNGTNSVTAQGALTDLNNALNGLTYTPNADFNGSDTLSIGIDDLGNSGSGGALTDAKSVSITILPVNDAPSFTKGADVIVVDTDPAQSIAAWATALSAGPADEQVTQTLSFIVSNDNNALFNAQPAVSPAGTLTFTPKPGVTGAATVTVQIHDDGGTAAGGVDTSAPQTFKITVENVPTITSANATTFTVGAAGSFSITAVALPAATITESGALPAGVTFNGPATSNGATLSGTPQLGSGGVYNISFTATNTHGSSAAQSFTLTVDEIPTVGAQPADTAVCDGATATFTASAATGYPAATVQWQISTDGGATFNNIVGATATTLSFTAVAANNGSQYRAVFTNGSGSVPSNAAILTVNTAPVVTTDPVGQTVCAGSTATFTATASGQPVPTVQWQVSTDGGATFNDLVGATSTTLSFTSAAGDNGHQYRAQFTNVCGANVTTAAAALTVDTLPVVTTDPLTQTVCAGSPVTFTAAATSNASDHTVQWQVDSGAGFTDISGATSTTLSFAATAGDQGKKYRALFTDACGNTASATALLSVDSLPVVSTDPVSQAVCAGSTATFTAAATSNASDETIQWQLSTDGGATFTDIGGATSTTFSFTTAAADNGKQYRATFTTSCGSTSTAAGTLSVDSLPVVTVNPLTQTLCAGAAVTFTAAATSNASDHTVQWQVSTDGGATFTDIGGATSTTFSFATAASDNGKQYRAVFTDACGSVNTSAAMLTVDTLPVVTTDPASQTVCAGGTATFTVAATSNASSHTVQWQVDSGAGFTNIPGATSTTLSFATTAADNGSQYRAVFTTACGSVNTAAASLRVDTLAVVITNPLTQTICAGAPATFTAAATSNAGQTVQWQVDSGAGFNDIPGETSTTLTFVAAVGDNGKQYRAVFSNSCGTANTAAATLTVDTLPVVTTDPLAQSVCSGATATFTAAATSNANDHTVQWQVDSGAGFTDIPGATSTTLSFATVAGDNGKKYRAVFTTACGSTASAAATLTTDTLSVITTNPLTQTVCAGSAVTFTAGATSNAGQTVQWEVSTDGGATFNPITGATSTTLNFTTTAADNGRKYHAVFTNSCGSTTTSAATLVVDTLPVVITDPATQTVCAGATATFTSSATSNAGDHTVQWEVSTDGGGTFTPIGGATSTTLSFATAPGDDGHLYHAVFTDACGSVTSAAATLTVTTAPSVTANPAPTTVCESTLATFTASASGSPTPTVQWEVSTDGGATFNPIAGATSTSYSFTASAADNTKQYHAVFTNSCGTATTTAATLTVDTAPAITTNPTSQSVVVGSTATFTAAASGTPAPTVQWQVSTNSGVTFTDVTGATSTTYNFTVALSDNGKQFRAVFTNSCGTATTNAATLTVTCPTITPARTGGGSFPAGTLGTAYSGQSFTASGGTAPYTFAVSGGTFPTSLSLSTAGAISGTPTATGTFVFTVTATDANGCTGAASFTIPINPSAVGDSYSNLVNNTEAAVTGGSTASPATPFVTLTGTIIANDLPAGGVAATSGTFSSANGTNNVVIAADGTFRYTPPTTLLATDTFNYTITSNTGGTGTPTQATGTVTLNLANRVWYVKNNAAVGGNGQSQAPFNTLAAAQTASAAGDIVYVYTGDGTTTGQNAGITLKANQQLIGNGVALVVNGNTLVAAGTKPQITNTAAASDIVTLNDGNTVKGMTITGTAGARDGISSVSAHAGFTADSLTVQNNVNVGVDLISMTGTVTITNSTISSASNQALTINNGTAAVTVDNTNTINGGTGTAVSVLNRPVAAGAIAIGAPITNGRIQVLSNLSGTIGFTGTQTLTTTTNAAVTLTTNAGATINFSGTLNITTTTGTGFNASGGGTLNVSGTANITTGAAANGLILNGLTIGVSGVTFNSVSTTGATTGVALTNVTGTVTINGGTISNGTTGVSLQGSSTNLTLAGVTITGPTTGITNTTNFGTLTIGASVNVSAVTALNLTTGAISGTFANVSSTGGTNGVNLNAVTGTWGTTAGSLTGATGATFNVNGGSGGTISWGGTINQANGANVVTIAGSNSNTINFSGNVTTSGTSTGINISGSSGTYNFTGAASTIAGSGGGITIFNESGTISFGSGMSITAATTSFKIGGSATNVSANITYSGTITNNNNGGILLDINSALGTFNGTLTMNGSSLSGSVNQVNGIISIIKNMTGTLTVNNLSLTSSQANFANTLVAISGTNTGGVFTFNHLTLSAGGANNTGKGLTMAGGGTLSVTATGGNSSISVGSSALDLNGVTLNASAIQTVTSTGNGTAGALLLTSVTGGGTLTITGGSLAGVAGAGTFVVSGGNPSVSYGGTITQNAANRLVNIANTTSGTISFTDAATGLTAGAASTGININTANSNITFTKLTMGTSGARMTNQAITIANGTSGNTYNLGTVSIFTTGVKALSAATFDGTLNITGGTIDSSTATAIDINGPAGLTTLGISLTSVTSAGGTADGISIQNTNGAFTISGTGAAGTGGTISGKNGADGSTATGIGIFLNNASSVSLSWMQLNDFQNFGIRGTSVTGFTLSNSVVNSTGGGWNGTNATGGVEESSISFDGLFGSASITNGTISGGFTDNVRVVNTNGSLNRLTMDTLTLGAVSNGASAATDLGDDSVHLEASGTATLNVTFQNSFETSARGDLFNLVNNGTGSVDLIFNNNKLSNNYIRIATGGGGVSMGTNGTGNFTYSITNSTFRDAVGQGLLMTHASAGNASMVGTISGNQIGAVGVTNSGSLEGDAIKLQLVGAVGASGGTFKATLTGNTITQYNNFGIDLLCGGGAPGVHQGTFEAIMTGNTIGPLGTNTAAAQAQGIALNGGTNVGDIFAIYITLGGSLAADKNSVNNWTLANGMDDIRLRQRQATTVHLTAKNGVGGFTDYAGANNDNAAVVSFVQANNTTTGHNSATNTVPTGGGFVGGSPP